MHATADLGILQDDVRKGSQGWTREVTVETPAGAKLRAHVYRDSYASQSRIYSEVWNPTTMSWNRVQTLSGSDHDNLPHAYSKLPQDEQRVSDGSDELVEQLLAYARIVIE